MKWLLKTCVSLAFTVLLVLSITAISESQPQPTAQPDGVTSETDGKYCTKDHHITKEQGQSLQEWFDGLPDDILLYIRDKINVEIIERGAENKTAATVSGAQKSDVILAKNLGSFYVELISLERIVQSNQPCLVVGYRWYHTEKDAQMFTVAFMDEAYQNGIQLIPYMLVGKEDNTMTKVMANTEIVTYRVYMLRDETSKVSVDLKRMLDFTGKYGKLAFTASF